MTRGQDLQDPSLKTDLASMVRYHLPGSCAFPWTLCVCLNPVRRNPDLDDSFGSENDGQMEESEGPLCAATYF